LARLLRTRRRRQQAQEQADGKSRARQPTIACG
jgi:hypothetical protein